MHDHVVGDDKDAQSKEHQLELPCTDVLYWEPVDEEKMLNRSFVLYTQRWHLIVHYIYRKGTFVAICALLLVVCSTDMPCLPLTNGLSQRQYPILGPSCIISER